MLWAIFVVKDFRRSCEGRVAEYVVDGAQADAVVVGRVLAGVAVFVNHLAYARVAFLDLGASDCSALDAAASAGVDGVVLSVAVLVARPLGRSRPWARRRRGGVRVGIVRP